MGSYRTLPYYGGKRGYGIAEWIASYLPWDSDSCYVKPFAGMAGVLFARQPVKPEALNDLNRRVINWWRVARYQPDEFGWLVEMTPKSRVKYQRALTAMDDESLPPMRRALAFHIAVDQIVIQSDNAAMGNWQRRFNPATSSIAYHTSDEIHRRSSRLRTVRLECVDACVLLDRIKDLDSCTIYADPPYPTANTTGYAVRGFDRAGLADVLMAQQGAVGVSGYGDEWDLLGWRRVIRPALRRQIKGEGEERLEVLWLKDKAAATRPGLFG